MKKALLLICLLYSGFLAQAQTVDMKYEGAKDIRVICGNYFIYMTLVDIKDAYLELPQPEQQKYHELMDLPNGIKATINIIQGSKAQASIMEPVVQRHVGGQLLKQGLAYIETKDGKKIARLEWKEGEVTKDEAGFDVRPITFYEPGTKKAVFTGTINNIFK
jgi:hypothetical protein